MMGLGMQTQVKHVEVHTVSINCNELLWEKDRVCCLKMEEGSMTEQPELKQGFSIKVQPFFQNSLDAVENIKRTQSFANKVHSMTSILQSVHKHMW